MTNRKDDQHSVASSSTPRQSLSPKSSADTPTADTLPPFRYETEPPNHEVHVSPKHEPAPLSFPTSSQTPHHTYDQLHPPSHASLADRRHSSASPPPHLPALTLQRPSAPHEQGGLPPISPLQPFDFGSFDNRRRGSITDPSLHVATTTRGGSPRAGGVLGGGAGAHAGQRSPTEISPVSSSNPNSPSYLPSFPPSAYPFPNSDQRRTSITSITSNTSSTNTPPTHNAFYSPSPLSSSGKQHPPPSRPPFFQPSHLSSQDKRDNSVSPTSNGRTPTPADRMAIDSALSPRSSRPAYADDRMNVDEGPLGEAPRPLPGASEGRTMPTPTGLPTRPGLPRHTSNSGGNPSRPWTPNEDGGPPPAFGKMQGLIVRESTTDPATMSEERDRFSNRLPQFDYSQRRHSIAVGYPTPTDSSGAVPPPPPPPPGWSQAALKRKMSHDRAAVAGGPHSHHPSAMDASEPPSPSSGPFRPPFPPGVVSSSSSASPSSEGGPAKRRGSAYDSKMASLTLAERPDGGAGLQGGWWADRRDSSASLWSNASHVSSTQGGYGTSQTSYTGGGGGSGSDVGGGKPGYAWPAPGAGYHPPPTGQRQWQPQSQGPTDPNSRSNSPVGGTAQLPPNGAAYQTPHHDGRAPVFRDLAGYSMDRGSSSARSSATVTNGPMYNSSGLPSTASKNSSPSSSVSPAGTSMPPPNTYHGKNHESSSSQGSYHQMSSHLAPPASSAAAAAAAAAAASGEGSGGEGGETPYSRSPELRVSHKLAERKRRKEMKELFDELKDHLPADRGMKSSKWEILSKAVDYINQIKSGADAKDREIELLRHELSQMRGGGGPPPPSSSNGGPLPPSDHHHQQGYHPQQYHPHAPPPPPPSHQQAFAPSAQAHPAQPFAPGYAMGGGGGGFAPHVQSQQSSVRSSYQGPPSSGGA